MKTNHNPLLNDLNIESLVKAVSSAWLWCESHQRPCFVTYSADGAFDWTVIRPSDDKIVVMLIEPGIFGPAEASENEIAEFILQDDEVARTIRGAIEGWS